MAKIDTAAIEAITSLQQSGKPDLFGKIFSLFEQNTPALLDAIETGAHNEDPETVRAAAHSLKSSAAYVGASELSELSKTIERAAREEQLKESSEAIEQIRDCYEETLSALKIHLDKAA